MKIQAVFLIYNCQELIINTLTSYLNKVDRIMIFIDKKSSDNTEALVNDFRRAHLKADIEVHKIKFDGFANTRNACLDKSYNIDYDWTMMFDDSFILETNNQESLYNELMIYNNKKDINCISISIQTKTYDKKSNASYPSKRIIRTVSRIRYTGTIHEEFASASHATLLHSRIIDYKSKEAFERSCNRIDYDIQQLKGLTDNRSLFLRANMEIILLERGRTTIDNCIQRYAEYIIKSQCTVEEEAYVAMTTISELWFEKFERGECDVDELADNCIFWYIRSAVTFPNRAGESYFKLFIITNNIRHLELAYKNRFLKEHRLPMNENFYSYGTRVGIIESEYNKRVNQL